MHNRLTLNYRLVGLVALLQPFWLLSLALPSFSQQTIEEAKVKAKIEEQATKESEKIAEIKAKEVAEAAKIKEKEAAELAKIKEKEAEATAKAREKAEHGHHSPPSPTPPAPAPVSQGAPNVNGVSMFPGSIFNADISSMPVDANSANWLNHLSINGASGAILYLTFGPCSRTSPGGSPSVIIGYPINVVGPSQARVPFVATIYQAECDPGPMPMPANAAIEGSLCVNGVGGPVSLGGGDAHGILLQTETTDKVNLWEMWKSVENSNHSWSGFMSSWNTRSNNIRPNGWTSANAGGMPMLPLMVKYDEVKAGAINHAMYASINWVTDNACVWPSTHTISSGPNDPTNYCPMGACLRLHADFDIAPYNNACQIVLRALKKYGMYVMDVNGGGNQCTLQGEANNNWTPMGFPPLNDPGSNNPPPGDLSQLGYVTMNNFDFVDVKPLMVSPTSYAAASGSTNSVAGVSSDSGTNSGGITGLQIESHHSNSAARSK